MNQRPTGVTILAILAFVGGILSILGGLALVGLGGVFAAVGGGLAVLFGIYALVWGALALWIGWGFWQLRPSAWRWGIILMVIGVIITIIQIPLGYSGGIASAVISIAIDLAVIYYLTTPAVRAAFGQPTSGSMTDAVMMAFGMGGAGGAATAGGGGGMGMSAPPAEPPAMSPPPPEPPTMSPPTESSWGSSTESSTGGASDAGEEENR